MLFGVAFHHAVKVDQSFFCPAGKSVHGAADLAVVLCGGIYGGTANGHPHGGSGNGRDHVFHFALLLLVFLALGCRLSIHPSLGYYADTCEDKQLSDTLYDVLDTPVSPELLPPGDGKISQKTEDLVCRYELHDFFLYYMLRQGFSPAKIYRLAKIAFAGTYEDAFILKWLKTFCRRFFAQQFKRSCLPDGPKVGSVAVSPRGDLRMPSDACATLWMEELNTIS